MTDLLARHEPERAPTPPPRPGRTRKAASSGWFRAVWRWHFFASFLVVPVLLLLATTGLIYLFRFQLEPLMHADLMKVDPSGLSQPYSSQLSAVEQAYPGSTAVSLAEPREADRATIVSITTADGAGRDVFVDPYRVEVLGSIDPDTTLSGRAILLHGELMAGTKGDLVIELGACWALVMALTGYFLFFRGWRARRRARKAGRKGAKLRYRHGLVGAFVGVGLLTLLVTGLPWTGFWGAKVQTFATERGSSMWSTDPGAASNPASTLDESLPHSHQQDVPWGQGASEVPEGPTRGRARRQRRERRHRDRGGRPRGAAAPDDRRAPGPGRRHRRLLGDRLRVRRAVGRADRARRPVRRRGRVDVRLRRLPAAGQGRLAGHRAARGPQPRAVVLLGLGADVPRGDLHVRHRPAHVVAAPPEGRAADGRAPRPDAASGPRPCSSSALVALGLFLPLFGISLLVVLLLDQLVLRRVPALSRWFDSTPPTSTTS